MGPCATEATMTQHQKQVASFIPNCDLRAKLTAKIRQELDRENAARCSVARPLSSHTNCVLLLLLDHILVMEQLCNEKHTKARPR